MKRLTHLTISYALVVVFTLSTLLLCIERLRERCVCRVSMVAVSGEIKFEPWVNSLASRNLDPGIIRLDEIKRVVPGFPPWYGWDDQDRVIAAIDKVLKHPSPELWNALVAHRKDPRYCVTFHEDSSYDEFAVNWTVGDFCTEIAEYQLSYPAVEVVQKFHLGGQGKGVSNPAWDEAKLMLGEIREGDGKAFWQRQVVLCRRLIENLPSARYRPGNQDISEDFLESCKRELEMKIAELEKIKVGTFGDFEFRGRSGLYQPVDVPRIREIGNKWERDFGRSKN